MASRGHQSHATRRPVYASKGSRTPSPKRGRRGSVTFDRQTSIFPENGEGEGQQGVLKVDEAEEVVEQQSGRGSCYGCHFLVENKIIRRLFRVCAVLNLISLVFSAPLNRCEVHQCRPEERDCCDSVLIQLIVITILDSLLAIIYTVQTYVRFQYRLCQCEKVCTYICLYMYCTCVCGGGGGERAWYVQLAHAPIFTGIDPYCIPLHQQATWCLVIAKIAQE